MPMYEYFCGHCSETVERLQHAPVEEIACPRCGRPAKLLVSIFAAGGTPAGGGCAPPGGPGFS